MAGSATTSDPNVRAALAKLADIVTPPPPDWAPRTWGWVGLAAVLLGLGAWALLAWRRRREAHRYRTEALGELARLERQSVEGRAADALVALPVLLKRVALAAWPRAAVASLSERRWSEFLAASAAGGVSGHLTNLLGQGEYRAPSTLASMSSEEARACLSEARAWIEGHRVST